MNNLFLILAYLFLGIGLRLTKRIPDDFSNHLNLFVIYVSLPALILLKVPGLKFDTQLIFTIAVPWIMVAFSVICVILVSKIFSWSRTITGCLLLMVPLGNTSFLGIPMVEALCGEKATAYAVVYDQLGSFLALSTYGSFILALFGQSQENTYSFSSIFKKIATFPPFIALLGGMLLSGTTIPPFPSLLLSKLASTLVPLVMIAVGFQLRARLEREALLPLGIGLLIKLCLAPMFALFIAWLLGLSGLSTVVSILEAGMPPMVSAGALAIIAGLSPRLTAALVGFGIFASFFTLPILKKIVFFVLQGSI